MYENSSSAYGIFAYHADTIENTSSGIIRGKATAIFSNENEDVQIRAYGIYTPSVATINNLNNSGLIEAIAIADGTAANSVSIDAAGIEALTIGTLTNSGQIKTIVTNYYNNTNIEASGIKVGGGESSSINNTGTIFVQVNVPSDYVDGGMGIAGIRITNGDIEISNTGSINLELNGLSEEKAKTQKVHTLWIENGNVFLKDKFAITFGTPGIYPSTDNTTNLNQRPIYVGSGATLNLNNATLIARADSRNLKLGEKYYLIYNADETLSGEWGGLEKGYANPSIQVNWAGEDYAANSAVIFTYEPQTSATMPVVGGMAGAPIVTNTLGNLVFSFDRNLNPLLIGESKFMPLMFASSAVSDVPMRTETKYTKGIWFMPVYTKTKAKDLGFDADTYGFALGVGGQLSDNLYGGLFAGYVRNNLDFKVREATDEDQDILLGGLGFLYAPKPWYAKLVSYAYTADHDYKGRTGLNYELLETADYKSRGFYTELLAGYIFGDKVKFAPEIGLSYGYYKTKNFTTSVPDNPALARVYEPDSLDVFKAIAGFNVKGDIGDTQIFGGIRLEQALGDNDISTLNYIPGQPKYKLEKSIADTTLVLNAGLNYNISKRVSLELGGRVDFNGDYKAYTGRGVLKVAF